MFFLKLKTFCDIKNTLLTVSLDKILHSFYNLALHLILTFYCRQGCRGGSEAAVCSGCGSETIKIMPLPFSLLLRLECQHYIKDENKWLAFIQFQMLETLKIFLPCVSEKQKKYSAQRKFYSFSFNVKQK